GEEINRTARRLGIDYKVATFCQLEAIGWIMAEIVVCQLWVLPCLADIHRHPASICEKFGPAMIAVDRPFVFVRGNSRAYGKTSWYPDAARQSNKISVKIGTVAGPRIAGVESIAASPAGA